MLRSLPGGKEEEIILVPHDSPQEGSLCSISTLMVSLARVYSHPDVLLGVQFLVQPSGTFSSRLLHGFVLCFHLLFISGEQYHRLLP
jgi:hypothetical protein